MSQLGVDRVVDLQFGSNEAAYHIIIELYDRVSGEGGREGGREGGAGRAGEGERGSEFELESGETRPLVG